MRKLLSFVFEELVFLFVLFIGFLSLLMSDLVIVHVKPHVLSYGLIFMLTALVFYHCNVLKTGLKATVDFLFRQSVTKKGTVVGVFPYDSGWFSEVWDQDRSRKKPSRFYVIVQVKGVCVTLISSSPALCQNRKINVRYGRFSHVVMDFQTMDDVEKAK